MAKKLKVNEGDWICSDKSCGNINFSWRAKCNKCGKDKGRVDTFKKTGAEIGKNAAGKSGGLFSSEDWQCSMCGNVNWARRSECNVCQHPKYNRIEARTGLGGGYCERVNVEYIEREESDDEIDEFGRKKRKFRKKSDNQEKKKEEEEEEEEDDESVDLSKYEIADSDAEGDSDADLSKYDLVASDTEEAQSEQKKDNNSVPAGGSVVGSSKDSSSFTGRRRSRSRSKEQRRSRSSSRERRHSRSRSRSPRHRRRSRSRSWSRSPPRRLHRRSNRSRSRSKERRRSYRSRSRSRERHH